MSIVLISGEWWLKNYRSIVIRNDKIKFIRIIKGNLLKLRTNCGLCCYSETNDNILLWSHYADKHQGLCIEFNTTLLLLSLIEQNAALSKVFYTNSFEPVNYLKDGAHAALKWIFTKADNWSSEKEVRLFCYDRNGLIEIQKQIISAIYFGCKVPESKIQEAIDRLKANGYNHLKFYRFIQERKKFSLIAREFK